MVEEINHVKNDIDRYKSVGTAIGLNIRKNDSRSKFYLHQGIFNSIVTCEIFVVNKSSKWFFLLVNAKELGHNLRLKYKRLVKEEQVYKSNEENLKAVENHKKTMQLYKIGL